MYIFAFPLSNPLSNIVLKQLSSKRHLHCEKVMIYLRNKNKIKFYWPFLSQQVFKNKFFAILAFESCEFSFVVVIFWTKILASRQNITKGKG